MSVKIKNELKFLDESDLTDEMVEITRRTYEAKADRYVLSYERRQGALEEARLFTLDPFLRMMKKKKVGGKILFAGCGSGRDMGEAVRQGYECVGIDISEPMLNIGKIMGIEAPMMIMNLESLAFPVSSFGGIFCETALAHVKKKHLSEVLKHYSERIVDGGVALITFRLGNGRVYEVEDIVGKRFFTSVTENEGVSLVRDAGFKIESRTYHQVGGRPAYYDLIVSKHKTK